MNETEVAAAAHDRIDEAGQEGKRAEEKDEHQMEKYITETELKLVAAPTMMGLRPDDSEDSSPHRN
jgi:hypothetical protein